VLLDAALKTNYISEEQLHTLKEWRQDPFGWGGKNGFPRVVKT
jgi:orotate phosphoribosyltransferase